jgi:hypothetical protein
MGMAQVGDSYFTLAVIGWIGQKEFLSERNFRREHHQGTMRTDRDRKCLFQKRAVVGGFTANDDRQVQQDALAASLRCLRQSVSPLGLPHYHAVWVAAQLEKTTYAAFK